MGLQLAFEVGGEKFRWCSEHDLNHWLVNIKITTTTRDKQILSRWGMWRKVQQRETHCDIFTLVHFKAQLNVEMQPTCFGGSRVFIKVSMYDGSTLWWRCSNMRRVCLWTFSLLQNIETETKREMFAFSETGRMLKAPGSDIQAHRAYSPLSQLSALCVRQMEDNWSLVTASD